MRNLPHRPRIRPLSACFDGPATRQGLVLGYAGVDEDEIGQGVKHLALTLADCGNS